MLRNHLLWIAALVVADVVMSIVAATALPTRVPAHWNIHGEVDRYGAPSELTVLFPAIIATNAVLAGGVAATKPFGPAFGRVAIAIVGMFVGVHAVALMSALGRPVAVVPSILVLMAMLLAVMGNSLGKIRPNHIYGIRTPWTLKSDLVWERTHRMAGRLQVAHAAAVLLAAFLLPVWAGVAVLIGGLLVVCTWAGVYSRRLYRATEAAEAQA